MTEQPRSWGYSVTGIVTPAGSQPVGVVAVAALPPSPAEVEAAGAGRRDVDLLPRVLAHVADPQVAGRRVERCRGTGCAARSGGSRARAPSRPTNGLSAGIAYGSPPAASTDVDPEHLAQQLVQVRGPVLGIAARPAVAQGDQQHPGRVEPDQAAVVVGVGLRLGQQDALGRRVERSGVAGRAREVAIVVSPLSVRVVDEDSVSVAAEARRERDPEQPALAARLDAVGDVEERVREERAVRRRSGSAALLADREPARAVGDAVDPVAHRAPSTTARPRLAAARSGGAAAARAGGGAVLAGTGDAAGPRRGGRRAEAAGDGVGSARTARRDPRRRRTLAARSATAGRGVGGLRRIGPRSVAGWTSFPSSSPCDRQRASGEPCLEFLRVAGPVGSGSTCSRPAASTASSPHRGRGLRRPGRPGRFTGGDGDARRGAGRHDVRRGRRAAPVPRHRRGAAPDRRFGPAE